MAETALLAFGLLSFPVVPSVRPFPAQHNKADYNRPTSLVGEKRAPVPS